MSIKSNMAKGYSESEANYLYLFQIANKDDYVMTCLAYIMNENNIPFDEAVKVLQKDVKRTKKIRKNQKNNGYK